MLQRLARARVPLGFVCALAAFWLAQPTLQSILPGLAIAVAGECLPVWAAGHIEKGREVTRSGPYRWVRHPLYLGSSIMALGFIVAARSIAAAIIVATYMLITLIAAMRTEEAALDARFDGEYSAYRAGTAAPVTRSFSTARVLAHR